MQYVLALTLLLCSLSAASPPTIQWEGPIPTIPDHLQNLSPKIINGVDANDGQFPYMVSLNYVGDGHACGASILTSNWVLTAAHCCLTGNALETYVGSIYLSGGGQTYSINALYYHGNYDPNSHWVNDICVIKINGNFQFSDRVQQVALPPQGWPVNGGDLLTITGWGVTTPSQVKASPDRLQVGYNYRALSNNDCGGITGVPMGDGYLCSVGNSGQGVCSGDSGGPLMKDGVQVGITSFVFLPCGSGLPDFYTRVPNYVNWIQQVLGSSAKELKFALPPQ